MWFSEARRVRRASEPFDLPAAIDDLNWTPRSLDSPNRKGVPSEAIMNLQHRAVVLRGLSLVALALLAGCGPRELSKNETYPVNGIVRLHGQPAAFVLVRLEPTDGKGAEAQGTTREDGSFELRTYSNEDNDGAVPGEYKVTIEEFDAVRGGSLPKGSKPTKVAGGVLDAGTIQIKAGTNNPEIDIP
jgi:hypothetical protein